MKDAELMHLLYLLEKYEIESIIKEKDDARMSFIIRTVEGMTRYTLSAEAQDAPSLRDTD